MNPSDKKGFKALMVGLVEYYRSSNPKQETLSNVALQIYFGALQRFTLEQIGDAVSAHLADTKEGQFFPKVANLVKHIEGGEITADMIIAAAKLADTPLGCLARIQIGSWDLDNQDGFYLRQRAAECLQLLPRWKIKAAGGDYSDHEVSVMLKYSVNPAAPFAFGLAAPENASALLKRAEKIAQSDRHLRFIEPPYDGDNDKSAGMHPRIATYLESEEK